MDAKNDTYKKFRQWLDDNFTLGIPTEEEWDDILLKDEEHNYYNSTTQEFEEPSDAVQTPGVQDDNVGVEYEVDTYST